MRHYERVLRMLGEAQRLITRAAPDWSTELPVTELVFNHATHRVKVPFHATLCVAIKEPARGCVVFFDGQRNLLEGFWLVTGCASPYVEPIREPIEEIPWQLVGLENIWPVPRRGQQILDLPFVRLVILDPVLQ